MAEIDFLYVSLSAESKNELSLYAKNYLPILFNLYTAEEKEGDPDKLPILETVRVYLSITDHKVSTMPFSVMNCIEFHVCSIVIFFGARTICQIILLIFRLLRTFDKSEKACYCLCQLGTKIM